MIIRPETPADVQEISDLAEAAFEGEQAGQQTEPFIIRDLRAAGALSISLVTEVDGQIVGHIAFSPVTISDGTQHWHGLGPLSVLPGLQGRRIGTALVNQGLALLKSLGSRGCALVGLPTYYRRFGFMNHPQLRHEGTPREIFTAKPLAGPVPAGILEFHQAFRQLSLVEKDVIADAIIDFEIAGMALDPSNPAVQSLMDKEILMKMPDGKFMLRPSAIAPYDTYFAKVSQFRATEMSRVHKNPFLTAVTSGTY